VNANPRTRLSFIDGLRGIAAISVMLYHYSGDSFRPMLAEALPTYIAGALGHGWLGVQIFFVLSGFVITYALGERTMTPNGVAVFVLRRQIRLDPPYWASIAYAVIHAWNRKRKYGGNRTVPSLHDIGLNVVYLQELMGVRSVQAVYWTLAIEIQLYLAFVILLWLVQTAQRVANVRSRDVVPWAVFAMAVWSLDVASHWRSPLRYLFPHFYLFAMGACLCFVLAGRFPRWAFLASLLGASLVGLHIDRFEPIVGALTTAIIYYVARNGALATALRGPVWQWLGKLSYGIYLTHTIAGAQARGALGNHVRENTFVGWLVITTCAVVYTLMVSWAFYRWIETPAMALSAKIQARFGDARS
jgi:peptidoglycan/LPS O-acetylase OafA/YrhL